MEGYTPETKEPHVASLEGHKCLSVAFGLPR